jgi:anti-sigma regulatory factor (Ser/Thr protein kinase)
MTFARQASSFASPTTAKVLTTENEPNAHACEAAQPDLAHGRGIKMSLRIFDRVRYNSRGNSVTVAKKLPPQALD